MKLAHSLLLIALAATANAQNIFYARDFLYTLQFKPGRDIVPDPSGTPMALYARGIYVAGTFQISGFAFQSYLRRYDLAGREMWTQEITAADVAHPAAIAADDTAVYVAGSAGDRHTDVFLYKYDEAGTTLWSRRFRISEGGYQLIAGMAIDASGLYLAAWDGRTQGLLRKYSPNGEELWSRLMTVRSLRGLAVADGAFISGWNDVGGFVRKYTAAGDEVWTRQLAASETETVVPTSVSADSTSVYVAGAIYRRTGQGNAFIPESGEGFVRRLDGRGGEVWSRRFGEPGTSGVVSMSVDSGGLYIAGMTTGALTGQCKAGYSDVFVRNYDTVGNEKWTRQFGTAYADFAGTAALDSSGVYISGGVRGGAAHGSLFVVKLPRTKSVSDDARPSILSECVVNAADYAGGGLAPGEIVTVFGKAMGPAKLTAYEFPADGHIANTLASARILFNGIPAPLLYVSETQSSAIVPYGVEANATVTTEVEYGGMRSEPLTLPVAVARPGIFTMDGSGRGQGAIRNEDGSLNSPENPAAVGSIITIFMTGAGLTDPAVADGVILTDVLPKPALPVTVLFDNPDEAGTIAPAEMVSASGVSGAVAGLLQVKVRLPAWVRASDAAPLYVQAGSDLAESGVTVALR